MEVKDLIKQLLILQVLEFQILFKEVDRLLKSIFQISDNTNEINDMSHNYLCLFRIYCNLIIIFIFYRLNL